MFARKKRTAPEQDRKPKSASKAPGEVRPNLSLLSLESRLMFDAAAAATAAEVNQEQVAQEQAESAVSGDDASSSESQESAESQELLQAIATYSPGETPTEVVFVDPTVPNYLELLNGMDPNIEVIMLDGEADGIEQIASALSGRTGIDAIHIISHGTEGQLSLGTGTLTTDSMTGEYADELAVIKQSLSEQADLLVYGCDFAEGEAGQEATRLLSELTGADVAASTDDTGYAELGGDWDFEFHVGTIETEIVLSYDTQADWVGLLSLTASGGETRINTTTSSTQTHNSLNDAYNPDSVAMDSNGNFVSVWESAGNIYGQRYNSAGTAQGSEFVIASNAANERLASVDMNASGAFVVTWERDQGTGDYDIYARLYNSSGTAVTSAFLVNETTTFDQEHARVAMAADGTFVVVWESNTEAGGTYYDDIYAQRYDATGTKIGSNFLVNTTTSGDQHDADIAIDSAGNFVVVWSGERTAGTSVYSIYGQRYDASGVAQGGQFLVNSVASDNDQHASVAMNDSGNFVVTWDRQTGGGADADIQAQRFNSAGVAQGSAISVTNTNSWWQEIPNVSMDQSGNFVVSWSSQNQDGSGWGVYTRQYDSTGTALTTESRVATTTSNAQDYSGIAYQNGKVVVTWSGNGPGDSSGIFMQRYNAAGGNAAPTITSNGGGVTAAINVAENTTAVTTVTATDANADTVTYSISGGADASKFTINSSTGALSFITAPNYESPTDSGGNNIYDVIVTVKDNNGGADSQSIAVTVTNTNEGPTDLSSGIELNTDGGNDAYLIANNGGAILGGLSSVTFEIQFATSDTTSFTPLVSYAAPTNDNEFAFVFAGTDAYLYIANNDILLNSIDYTSLRDGTLQHLAVTWDNTNGDWAVYSNGVLIEQGTGHEVGNTIEGGGELVFGNEQDALGGSFQSNQAFKGTYYDIRIWNDVRTAGELAQYHQQQLDLTPAEAAAAGLVANWQMDGFDGSSQVVDIVSGNNLSIAHASGTGFTAGTVNAQLSIDESSANGSHVGFVTTQDPDAGETFSYSLTDSAGGRFAVNASTGEITVADGSLLDYESSTSHNITVRVTDSGGLTYDEVLTVQVKDLEDAPVNTVPGAQSTNEDTTLTFNAANSNLISIADDAGEPLVVTVAVNNGTVTLSGTTGLTFTAGDGTADATMTFSGTVENINAALDGLQYDPTADYSGSDTLTLTSYDQTLYSLDFDANLQARYTFEGNANDVAPGTAQDGTMTNGASITTDGTRGQVLSLDGVDDFVDLSAHTGDFAGLTQGTISGWIKTTGTNETIFSISDTADTGSYAALFLGASGYLTYEVMENGVMQLAVYKSDVAINDGNWHHVAVTIGPSGNSLYVDGVLATAGQLTYDTGSASTQSFFSDVSGLDSMAIGRNQDSSGGKWYATGSLDDVRLYDRVLSTTEVANLTNDLTLTDTDTVAITVNPVNDAPTDLSNGIELNTDGGNDAYLISDTGLSQSLSATTVEIRFAANDTPVETVFMSFNNPTGDELSLQINDPSNSLEIDFGAGTTVNAGAIDYRAALVDGTVHTLSVTWDSTAGDWAIYIDGVFIESGTGLSPGTSLDTTNGQFVFGQEQDGLDSGYDSTQYFSGTFYDVRIWNDVRTAGELAQYHQQQLDLTPAEAAAAGLVANWQMDGFDGSSQVVDIVSGNNLSIAHASGTGFTAGTVNAQLSIDESSANGSHVGFVTTQDPDAGETFSYSLTDSAGGRFAVNASTGEITVADGSLLDYESSTSHNITVRVTDSGGLTYDEVLTVQVKDLEDAPVNTVPGAQSTNEDTTLTFNAANSNLISIADDAGEPLVVTVAVNNGTVTLSGTTGLTFTAGDGTADATMTFSGTVENINAALDGLQYDPTADYSGSDTLTLTSYDQTLYALDLDANLQGYYQFDSADPGNDSSPGGTLDGTLNGDATVITDGIRGDVLSLDGTGDYVEIAGTVSNPTNVTLSAWVKYSSAPANGGEVISIGNDIALRVDDWTQGVTGFFWDGTTHQFIGSSVSLADNNWHHIAFTFDDGANTQSLYIDGTLVASGNFTSSITYTGWFPQTTIGTHADLGDSSFDFSGLIDDARIYDRALSASEIQGLASAPVTASDTDTVAITVNPVNDAPVISNLDGDVLNYTEGDGVVLIEQGGNALVTDIDSANFDGGNLNVEVDSGLVAAEDVFSIRNQGTGSGQIGVSGSNVTYEGVVIGTFTGGTGLAPLNIVFNTNATADAVTALVKNITYENTNTDNPTASARSVTIDLTDGDGGASPTQNLTINVSAVNDAPVNTVPGAQTVDEDTPLGISGISVNDVDDNLSTVQLSVDFGRLTVTLSGSATITAGANNGPTLTLSGTQADINATLASLVYQGPANYSGSATLTVLSTDANSVTDSDTVAITVSPVNDAPVNTVPGAQTVAEDSTLTFSSGDGNAITLGDADAGNNEVELTLSVTSGTLSLDLWDVAGTETVVNTSTTGTQADVEIATAPSGEHVMVWESNHTGSYEIYAQRYDAAGNAIGGEILVNATTSGTQSQASVAMDANGNFVVVWRGSQTGDTDMYARIFDASGTPLTGEFRVNSTLAGNQTEVDVAMDANGNFVVVWEGFDADSEGIFGQRFDAAGNFLGGEFQVNTTVVDQQDDPSVAMSADGSFVVVWESYLQDGSSEGVYGQLYDATGAKVGSEFRVAVATSGSQNQPDVAMDDAGNFVVVWEGGDAGGRGVYLRQFSANGTPLTGDVLVNQTQTNDQTEPNVSMNGAGEFVVAWSSSLQDGSGSGAYARHYAADGSPTSGEFLLHTDATGDQLLPAVAAYDYGFHAAWEGTGPGDSVGVFRRVSDLTFVAGDGVADSTITVRGTLAELNAALDGLTYTPNANYVGSDTLTITTNDLGNTGTGGALQDVDTVAITVTSVNDAPVNTVPGAQVVNEDTPLSVSGLSVTDVDGNLSTVQLGVLNGTVSVTLQGGATISAGANGSGTLTLAGSQADINATLATLVYQGTLNYNGPDTLTVTSTDANSGTDVDTVAITVTSVNDAPVNTVPGAQVVNEDTPLSVSGLSVTDVDGNLSTVQLGVLNGTVSVTLQGGATISAGANGSGTLTLAGSQADINATLATLVYQGTLNYNGPDTLTVTSTDANSGTDVDTVAITVTSVNDAPVNTVPGAQVVNEDTPLSVSGLSVTDVDGNLSTVQLGVLNGTVSVTLQGGATISAGANGSGTLTLAGSQADINATLATLVYQGTLNYNGPDTLTVTSTDANSGTDVDTVAITVTSVNDAPVNTVPGAQVVNEDTPLSVSGLSVTDVDGNLSTVQLGVLNGTVSVTLQGGATISAGANGSGTLTLAGSQADINATLATLVYQGTLNYNGPDTLTVTSTDANSGTDVDTVAITVTSVNDAPVNTVPGAQVVNEDTPLSVSGLSVTDVDGNLSTVQLGVLNGTVSVTLQGGATISAGANGSGTLTLAGSQADINATLATLVYQGTLNYNGPDTLTVTSTDANSGTDVDTVAITVTSVNDAPVNTVPGAQVVNEDTPLSVSGLSVTDVDGNLSTVQLGVLNGTVSVTLQGGATISAGANGSGTLTLAGSQADINATLATLVYQGTLNYNGPDTLTVTSTDANSGTDVDTVAITVTSVNDAPVNTVPGAQVVNEDTPLSVSGLSVTDVDGNLSTVQLGVLNGTVSVTLQGGATISAGANGSGTLTLAGSQADINATLATLVYQGTLNYNGPDTLTVTSTDANSGTDVDTVAITVTSVNDAPVNTVPGAQVVNEDTPLSVSGLSVTDVDGNLSTVQLGVLNGTVSVTLQGGATISAGANGSGTLTLAGSQADINATLATLVYQGTLNYNGPDTLTVTSTDANSGTDVDTVAITVTSVNDAPVNTVPGAQVVNEDTPLSVSGLSVTDVDGNLSTVQLGVLNGTVSVTLQGGATISAGANGSGTLTLAGSQADINATLATLVYQGTLNYNGPDTLTVTSTDANSGTDVDTVAITVTSVNDAPVNTVPGAQVVNEDTPLSVSGLSVTDVDGNLSTVQLGVLNGTVSVTLQGGATISAGANGSGTLTLAGSQADINATLATLVYQGTLNYNGPDTLTVTSTDANSGTDVDTVAITVTSVNDAPVNTVPGAQVVNEDTPLSVSGLSVTDVDGNLSTVQLGVLNGTVSVTLQGGATISAGANGSGTLTLAGSQADINATLATLVYQGTLNYNGPDTLTVTSTDANSGTDVDTVAITVTSVNDAPVNTVPGAQVVNEDTPLSVSGLSVTDVDGNLSTVQLGVLNGTVSVTLQGGATISAGANGSGTLTLAGSQADINATLATLVYQGTLNYNGPDTLTVTSTDANSGTDVDTVAITVTSVNDAPVNTVPGAQVVNEDTPLSVSGLSVTDVDGNLSTVQLGVLNGTVSVTLQGGATISAGANGSGTLTLAGSQADINATLATLVYQGTLNYNGPDTLTVTSTDANSGTDVDTVAITVTSVNDAPTVVANTGSTVAEGGTDTINSSELAVSDVEQTAAQLTYSIGTGPAYGRLELTTAPGVAVTTFTQADIDLNRLVYVHDGSETTSDNFTFTVSDGAGGSSGATTLTLTITPVNDAPTIISNGGGPTALVNVVENVTAVTIVTGADVDLPAQTLTYSISGGVDQALFTINAATGALNFTAPPDFEVATDANGDNVYVLQVRVIDSQGASTTQTIQVTVTDVAEGLPPTPTTPPVPPVLLPPAPPGPIGPGPEPSTPPSPSEPPTDPLPPSPVTTSPGVTPSGFQPVHTVSSSPDSLAERIVALSDELKKLVDFGREQAGFIPNDEVGRPVFTLLPVEPVPVLEPEPAEKQQSTSELLLAKLGEMAGSLEQAIGVSDERHELVTRVAALTGTTLSAGFIVWALRSGALLASFMATMPAWRHFDPLPVLGGSRSEWERRRKDSERDQQAEAAEFRGLKKLLD